MSSTREPSVLSALIVNEIDHVFNDVGPQSFKKYKRNNLVRFTDQLAYYHKVNSCFSRNPCDTQLATMIDDWAKILHNQGQVDTFILDFEKKLLTLFHMNSLKASCSVMKLVGRHLNGLMLSFATDNKEFWLMALN